MRSTIGPRNPNNQDWYDENEIPVVEGAWSKENIKSSHAGSYTKDQPSDYVVEASTKNPSPPEKPALMQQRTFAFYPVESTLSPYEDVWSVAGARASDEEDYVGDSPVGYNDFLVQRRRLNSFHHRKAH